MYSATIIGRKLMQLGKSVEVSDSMNNGKFHLHRTNVLIVAGECLRRFLQVYKTPHCTTVYKLCCDSPSFCSTCVLSLEKTKTIKTMKKGARKLCITHAWGRKRRTECKYLFTFRLFGDIMNVTVMLSVGGTNSNLL